MQRWTLFFAVLAILVPPGLGAASDANCPPEACFTWCPVCPRVLEAFRFVDCSVDPDGEIVSWNWDFGDGTTSTEPEPVKEYARVGTYVVTLTITDDKGATATRTREITICRGPLIITAADATKIFGDPYEFTGTEFSVEGLVGSDRVISVTLVSYGAPAGAEAGEYAIWASDAVGVGLDNYDITYRPGTLTVTRRPLIITAADATKTYGDPYAFAGTEFTVDGLVGSDAVSSVTLVSDGAPADAAAAKYAIVASDAVGVGLENYDIIYRPGTLTVARRSLIITAADATKIFGDPYEFTGTEFSVDGLVGSDAVSNVTLVSDGAPSGAEAGEYAIWASDAVGVGLDNYDITYRPSTLRVKAPPVACFAWTPDCPREGEPFPLADCSTDRDGEVVSWSWDFGDGVTSTERHPVHQYGRAGIYSVTLTVTDDDGLTASVTQEVTICEALGSLQILPGAGLLTAPRSVLLVFDASQSMGWWLGPARDQIVRMDAAKAALRELVEVMPEQLNVGFLVYYTCGDIRLVVPVTPLDRGRLLAEIDAVAPTGATPIADALRQAPAALAGLPQPYLVVLISDGEETCGGDPVQTAEDLVNLDLDLRVDVVGLAVADEPEVVAQLRRIASAGKGSYFSAESVDALRTALLLTAPVRYRVLDAAGAVVVSGTVGDPAASLRVGAYRVAIDTALGTIYVEITVLSEKEIRMEVEYTDGVFKATVR